MEEELGREAATTTNTRNQHCDMWDMRGEHLIVFSQMLGVRTSYPSSVHVKDRKRAPP